jgi:protein-tyrosine phosphatase
MDVSRILPNLLVGTCPRSLEDVKGLRQEFGVTAALSVQTAQDMEYCGIDWQQMEHCYLAAGIEVRRVPVQDFDRDDLRRNLPKCVAVLDDLLQAGHTAYVHCNMGVNRSPSIVIAYLYWILGWDLQNAVGHVMKRRSCDPYVDVIRLATEDRIREQELRTRKTIS